MGKRIIQMILFSLFFVLFSTPIAKSDKVLAVMATDRLVDKNIDGNLYRRELTEGQNAIYSDILEGAKDFQSKIYFKSEHTRTDLLKAVHAFCYEHPEYYWINPTINYYRYGTDDRVIGVDFKSEETRKERIETYNKINSIADECISHMRSMKLTEYDEIKYLHDYILSETEYDTEAENLWDIRSVFINHRAICASYSRAYQYLMNRAGYECYFVSGMARGREYDRHAWNIVKYMGHYYWVDSTWDDGMQDSSKYFLVGNEIFMDHFLVSNEFDILGFEDSAKDIDE